MVKKGVLTLFPILPPREPKDMYMQVLGVGGYSFLTEDTLAFGPMEDTINHS